MASPPWKVEVADVPCTMRACVVVLYPTTVSPPPVTVDEACERKPSWNIESPPAVNVPVVLKSVMVKLPLTSTSPCTENAAPGEVVPTPTRPCESTIRTVDVAAAVDVEIAKSGTVPRDAPLIESRANGVVVPIPKLFDEEL